MSNPDREKTRQPDEQRNDLQKEPKALETQPELELPAPLQAVDPSHLRIPSESGVVEGQARVVNDPRLSPVSSAPPRRHFIARLQQVFGNRHVQRVLARRPGRGMQRGRDGALEASPEALQQIERQRGNSETLSPGIRQPLEAAFDEDFSHVRLHTGAEAQELSADLAARAFTNGSDIWLADPADASDTSLMAHELTHVVQQKDQPDSASTSKHVSESGEPAEQQAEQAAKDIDEHLPG